MARADKNAGTATAPPKRSELFETVRTIVEALLIALVVRTLLFQPFNIPSGSMIPTLLIGDYLFVSKYSYGYSRFSLPFAPPLWNGRLLAHEPQRGDVAVFVPPHQEGTDFIKRVIGLPGDKIQMIAGRLYINGEIVPRTADRRRDDDRSIWAAGPGARLHGNTAERRPARHHPDPGRSRSPRQHRRRSRCPPATIS